MFREPRLKKDPLFRTRAPRGYEYTPRYYDPEQERLDELKVRAGEAAEAGDDTKRFVGNQIRGGGMRRRSTQRGAKWAQLIRLGIILALMISFLVAMESVLAK